MCEKQNLRMNRQGFRRISWILHVHELYLLLIKVKIVRKPGEHGAHLENDLIMLHYQCGMEDIIYLLHLKSEDSDTIHQSISHVQIKEYKETVKHDAKKLETTVQGSRIDRTYH
jgi:hypothetical protein